MKRQSHTRSRSSASSMAVNTFRHFALFMHGIMVARLASDLRSSSFRCCRSKVILLQNDRGLQHPRQAWNRIRASKRLKTGHKWQSVGVSRTGLFELEPWFPLTEFLEHVSLELKHFAVRTSRIPHRFLSLKSPGSQVSTSTPQYGQNLTLSRLIYAIFRQEGHLSYMK